MIKTDLLIIGSGFWGTSASILAQRNGIDALVVDNERLNSGSRNAAGIIRKEWFGGDFFNKIKPSDWDEKYLQKAIEFLGDFGLVTMEEEFTTYRKPGVKKIRNCFVLKSLKEFLSTAQRKIDSVLKLKKEGSNWLSDCEKEPITAKKVLIVVGAFSDRLLTNSNLPTVGVSPLRGRAVIATGNCEMVKTYESRPYKQYTIRPYESGSIRLGDTVEKKLNMGDDPLQSLFQMLNKMQPGSKPISIQDGLRPVCDKVTVKKIDNGLVVATGGHRIGLGLSLYAVEKSFEKLEI